MLFLNLMCHSHQKHLETELNKATTRNGIITNLFSKTYEDNVSGKLSDEMFMELSHKYEVERLELKTKIFEYKERLAKISEMKQNKDDFIKAVRKFMEMGFCPKFCVNSKSRCKIEQKILFRGLSPLSTL